MALARFRLTALAVTMGAAAVALPLLSLAVPAQAAAWANDGGHGYSSGRPGAASMINNPGFAGYQASVAAASATSSAAQFRVPRLSCTTALRGAVPGVGVVVNNFRSFSRAALIVECARGRAVYAPVTAINGNQVSYATSVRAGNLIKVSVRVTTRGTTVQVTDVTTGFTKRRTGPGARSSAAFVGDDSLFSGATLLGMPNFGTLTFTGCLVDGRALARSHPARFQRVTSRGILQIATGALSSAGTAFPTQYRHF